MTCHHCAIFWSTNQYYTTSTYKFLYLYCVEMQYCSVALTINKSHFLFNALYTPLPSTNLCFYAIKSLFNPILSFNRWFFFRCYSCSTTYNITSKKNMTAYVIVCEAAHILVYVRRKKNHVVHNTPMLCCQFGFTQSIRWDYQRIYHDIGKWQKQHQQCWRTT